MQSNRLRGDWVALPVLPPEERESFRVAKMVFAVLPEHSTDGTPPSE